MIGNGGGIPSEGGMIPPKHRRVSRRYLSRIAAVPFLILLAGCGEAEPVEEPTPLYGEIPIEYPLDLWDADVEGEVVLRVRVTKTGVVDSVEVLEPSGYPSFDSAAVRGARQLRYSPARRDGEMITVWARVPVQFTKGDR
jgi:protein TonB